MRLFFSIDKTKDSTCGGAVFGVPLSCCVETTYRKRSSQLENQDDSGHNTSKVRKKGILYLLLIFDHRTRGPEGSYL